MQPIKTTNAMNPAPAKGIESFPTPVIDDVVISEIVNSWKGDYQPLEYGTLWKDVSHAPNQGSFPEHKLVYQQPTSEDGQWVKRIWVNDRVNQDSYNYAIKYSAGSQEHPIYIRTYVVPRETYGPIPDLTPDPLFPNAVLVDEEAVRNEGELDSKYITVTRVYETLPGPQIPTRRYNERGDLETVIVQTVFPNTPPDPDGLLVTGSQVVQEEVSKGIKTTSTVPQHTPLFVDEKKGGLLGETITTDNIVDPSTAPDPLSISVVSSSVEKLSATKARKRTTTGSPLKLSSKSLVESPLGLVEGTIENSIVEPNTSPTGSLNITKDSISPIDVSKAERQKVTVDNWPVNYGYDTDDQLAYAIPYTETIANYYDLPPEVMGGISGKSSKPIDQWKTFYKSIDLVKLSQTLLAQYYKVPIEVDVKLPDVLEEITVYWGHSYGEGQSFNSEYNVGASNYSMSSSGSSKNSYGINGDLYFKIRQGFSGAIKGEKHIFFIRLQSGAFSSSDEILKVLNNFYSHGNRYGTTPPPPPPGQPIPIFPTRPENHYKPWPYIQAMSENIVLITGGKSETFNSSRSQFNSINGFGSGKGSGSSIDVDVNARSINIPPTLHGELNIKQETFGTIGTSELSPTYGVRPETLNPTSVVLDGQKKEMAQFPVGSYLYSSTAEIYKYGFVKVEAITVEIKNEHV